ncbi:uncharacterized protein LOC123551595 isoform X2 [Mercenaria mercenaria]|uniref:uncharacterized protein LOC123551595 isoform X2 n=1 Tax=Mercenaria mercenaria TaxID=6596 RepID=UPI00234E4860|nr:uncharacterized protein LOC123551595 isoform X2 [Mercenaria mercenaria]
MPRAKRQETNGSPKRIPGDTAAPPRQPAVSVPQPVDLNPQQLKVVANRVAEHLRPMFAQQRSNLADDSAAQSDGVEQNVSDTSYVFKFDLPTFLPSIVTASYAILTLYGGILSVFTCLIVDSV